MSQALEKSPVTESDRLSFTVLMAVLFHVVLILGVGFDYLTQPQEPITNMEVIFIQNPNPEVQEDADYLAQLSQEGSGNVEEKIRPTAPPPSELPSDSPFVEPVQQVEMLPQRQPDEVQELMTQETAEQAEIQQVEAPTPDEEPSEGLTAEQLIMRSKEIASLTAEVSQQWQSYAKMPRKKFISASTKEYVAAAYLAAWQERVERIGNMNYPEAARRQNIYGNLQMSVELRADGSIVEIKILQPSGKKVIDDAAVRIVRLAAPFSSFPDSIRQEADNLVITRTWQFKAGGLATR
jgi:protein TonB